MNFKQHLIAGTATGIITGATAWYITENPIAGLAFAGITIECSPSAASSVVYNRSWSYIPTEEIKRYPGKVQPASVWGKAYWNFDKFDWQAWVDSFKTFPVGEYGKHVKSIIDMYMPDDISLEFIKSGIHHSY